MLFVIVSDAIVRVGDHLIVSIPRRTSCFFSFIIGHVQCVKLERAPVGGNVKI